MRILVGLIEHLGDIVACEPVSRYLRANHPGAHLAWAVSHAYRELIDTNPYIDETVELECLTDWIKLTKHDSFDKIVDLHVNYRVCPHCLIPLVKDKGNPFVNAYEWFDYGTLQEAFSLGAGLPALSGQPKLYLKPEHVKAADALALPDDFCVVHRTSNDTAKDWPDKSWRELSEWIRDDLKIQVVEVGAGKILSPSPLADGHISLVNKLPILQTAEVIRRARFFIGVDSGPAHLANALKVPGIVLLGRLSVFRQYMPFNGFFASSSPQVKMVRNLAGPVADLNVAEVKEAARYVSNASTLRREETDRVEALRQDNLPKPPYTPLHQHERSLVLASNFFDAGWYCVTYPDVHESGAEPLDHFLTVGTAEGRSPGPRFDSGNYLRVNGDVGRAGINALVHYINNGNHEGRQGHVSTAQIESPAGWPEETFKTSNKSNGNGSSVFLEVTTSKSKHRPKTFSSPAKYPRTFAFYLPQFHPINENNWAHGPGFTEWQSVIKTKPLFRNHYQPKVPGELGFYDLRSVDVLRDQLRLARQYGISGFCFYYYYFQGRTLLYQPIRNYIESDLDAPFFLLWANENWSKRWDGGDKEVIIEQKHSDEDDLAFIRGLLPLFEDRRYVKIDKKPILLIYKPHLFPNILSSTERWRKEAERHGFPGLYLVMVDDWFQDEYHPRQYGFDASYEIPSNYSPQEVSSTDIDDLELKEGFEGRIIDYRKFASLHLARPFPAYKRFRTVMLPWDNTARYGSRAIVHINGQGDAYKTWLTQALIDTYRRYPSDERIVFLHSWNEWCEGTYLEPDGKFGRMFLEQTGEAIQTVRHAIDLIEATPDAAPAVAEFLKVVQAKDEGAFRVMRATRLQTAHVWRELERARRDLAAIEGALSARNQELEVLRESLSRTENQSRAERDAIIQELEALRVRLSRSESDADFIRAHRDGIVASKSWRITGSLRAIAALLRRLS